MKKLIISVIMAVILTTVVILTLFELKAQKDQLQADGLETIDSIVLGEKRKLLVHLPIGYSTNSEKRYPVMYALDATSHDQDLLNASRILSLAEEIPNMIIVGLVNKNRNRDLTPNYVTEDQGSSNFGNGDIFLEFITTEVIPLIENKYRTTDYRMISGNSRAGLFALFSMIENPELFDAYFCFSPAFWRGQNLIIEKLKKNLADRELSEFVFLSLGDNENEKMKKGFDDITQIFMENDTTRLHVFYEYTKNANHGTNAYLSIPKALSIWNSESSISK